jgi:hypothetical protein
MADGGFEGAEKNCGRLRMADLRRKAMTPEEMKKRTRAFALRVIKLVESLPSTLVVPAAG